MTSREQPLTYQSALVALVGNTGVGKSGLAGVLGEQGGGFTLTFSTHGQQVQRMHHQLGGELMRDTWLWDLAGQPLYRLTRAIARSPC